jgi:hypothetical protein
MHWEKTDKIAKGNNFLSTHPLGKESKEWQSIQANFMKTMPLAQIVEIVRIQNRLIWNTYQTEINNFQTSKGEPPKVTMLYHGTRLTDPQNIYEGKEGFDMRYSNGGMWGQANYFAVNASYSDKYHHQVANVEGLKQIFYARVMIGNTISC